MLLYRYFIIFLFKLCFIIHCCEPYFEIFSIWFVLMIGHSLNRKINLIVKFKKLKNMLAIILTAARFILIGGFIAGLFLSPAGESFLTKIAKAVICGVIVAVISFVIIGTWGALEYGFYVGVIYSVLCGLLGWKNFILRFWATSSGY